MKQLKLSDSYNPVAGITKVGDSFVLFGFFLHPCTYDYIQLFLYCDIGLL